MFYRGFDGPLLRQRFLEGNDTHEIKLILAVSRNANVQRAKFHHRSKGLAAVRTESLPGRRGAWPQERLAGGAQSCWRRPQESAVWETVCHGVIPKSQMQPRTISKSLISPPRLNFSQLSPLPPVRYGDRWSRRPWGCRH